MADKPISIDNIRYLRDGARALSNHDKCKNVMDLSDATQLDRPVYVRRRRSEQNIVWKCVGLNIDQESSYQLLRRGEKSHILGKILIVIQSRS